MSEFASHLLAMATRKGIAPHISWRPASPPMGGSLFEVNASVRGRKNDAGHFVERCPSIVSDMQDLAHFCAAVIDLYSPAQDAPFESSTLDSVQKDYPRFAQRRRILRVDIVKVTASLYLEVRRVSLLRRDGFVRQACDASEVPSSKLHQELIDIAAELQALAQGGGVNSKVGLVELAKAVIEQLARVEDLFDNLSIEQGIIRDRASEICRIHEGVTKSDSTSDDAPGCVEDATNFAPPESWPTLTVEVELLTLDLADAIEAGLEGRTLPNDKVWPSFATGARLRDAGLFEQGRAVVRNLRAVVRHGEVSSRRRKAGVVIGSDAGGWYVEWCCSVGNTVETARWYGNRADCIRRSRGAPPIVNSDWTLRTDIAPVDSPNSEYASAKPTYMGPTRSGATDRH